LYAWRKQRNYAGRPDGANDAAADLDVYEKLLRLRGV